MQKDAPMDPGMTLDQVDVDGAIREAAHEASEALGEATLDSASGPLRHPLTAAEVLNAVRPPTSSSSTIACPDGSTEDRPVGTTSKHARHRPSKPPAEANMPNIGPMEILVVLIIALVVFGPKRLPELGKSLGRGIHEFKGSITGEHSGAEAPAALEKSPVTTNGSRPGRQSTGAAAHGPVTRADAATGPRA
jgi:sec-independent protein translocase protein TatA